MSESLHHVSGGEVCVRHRDTCAQTTDPRKETLPLKEVTQLTVPLQQIQQVPQFP